MKDSERKQLIQLFAHHPIDEIEADGGQLLKDTFGAARYEVLSGEMAYKGLYTQVQGFKKEIEDYVAHTPDIKKLIHKLLGYLKQVKQDEAQAALEVLSALIKSPKDPEDLEGPANPYPARKALYYTWDDEDRAYYDQRYAVITGWVDFFISYTNRNAGDTNFDFQELYESVYFYPPPESVRGTKNLVARIIVKYLNGGGLEGFADWEEIKSGDDIGKKIRDYSGKAYAFVQMVERACFTKPAGNLKNWCFEEYLTFKKAHMDAALGEQSFDARFHFLIADVGLTEVLPKQYPSSYTTWHDHMGQVNHACLKQKPHDGEPICISKHQLGEKLDEIAGEVVAIKQKVLDNLLSDY